MLQIKGANFFFTSITIEKKKVGTWYQNKFYGWNRLIDSNGNLYIGLFINDKLNGKGIKYTFPDHIYKGDFLNDLREGNGIDKYKGRKDRICKKISLVKKSLALLR